MNQPKKLYNINLDVFDDGKIKYGCSIQNMHPAEMIMRLSDVVKSLGLTIVQQAQKPKIDLIDPTKLPMKLRQ